MLGRVSKAVAVLLPRNGRAAAASAGEQVLREYARGKYDHVGVLVFGSAAPGGTQSARSFILDVLLPGLVPAFPQPILLTSFCLFVANPTCLGKSLFPSEEEGGLRIFLVFRQQHFVFSVTIWALNKYGAKMENGTIIAGSNYNHHDLLIFVVAMSDNPFEESGSVPFYSQQLIFRHQSPLRKGAIRNTL